MDPVVGLFAVGFLKSKTTREAGGKKKTVSMELLHHSHAGCPRGWMGQLSALSSAPGIVREQGTPPPPLPSGTGEDRGAREAAVAPETSRCRGPEGAEQGGPRRGSRAPTGHQGTHLLLLHEAHEGGALDLHGLPLPVVQSQDEVEKVGLPQVGRRLLLEVSSGQTHSAGTRNTRVSGSSDAAASRTPPAASRARAFLRRDLAGPPRGRASLPPLGRPGAFPSGHGEILQLRTPRSPDPIPPCGQPEAPRSPPSRPRYPPARPGGRARSQPALHGGGAALRAAGALPRGAASVLPLLKLGSELSHQRPCALSFEPFLPRRSGG